MIIKELSKALKYGIVGVIGTGIHFGTLVFLVEKYKVNSIAASSIGFIITVFVSYVLNRSWTFKTETGIKQFLKYMLVSINGLLINFLIMNVGVHTLKLNYRVAQLLVIAILPVVNYALNRLWVFEQASRAAGVEAVETEKPKRKLVNRTD